MASRQVAHNDKADGNSDDEEDPMESMGIGANIVMAFIALGFATILKIRF